MKSLLFTLFILVTSICSAQSTIQDFETENEVNQTLWQVFKDSYDNKDATTFNSIHTDDVMRISPWGIKIGDEYKDSNTHSFAMKPEQKQSINFAMEHRIYTEDEGYEVGFYRVIYSINEEVVHTSFARFHVRLKKVDGQWKIAQDWDISHINGEDFRAEDFEKGDLLELK